MHSDNCVFASGQFRLDCDKKHQEQFFFVGAQNQYTRPEREIQTIVNIKRTFMVCSLFHCTDRKADYIFI